MQTPVVLPASSAMAVATAMFRVANSVASVNRSDGRRAHLPCQSTSRQEMRRRRTSRPEARCSDSPFTKTTGSLATINTISAAVPPKPRALKYGCERLASAGWLNRTHIPRATGNREHEQQLRENQRERHGKSQRVAQRATKDHGNRGNGDRRPGGWSTP